VLICSIVEKKQNEKSFFPQKLQIKQNYSTYAHTPKPITSFKQLLILQSSQQHVILINPTCMGMNLSTKGRIIQIITPPTVKHERLYIYSGKCPTNLQLSSE
jgi:sensor c-di-GMP phosphodiesterase-like protein